MYMFLYGYVLNPSKLRGWRWLFSLSFGMLIGYVTMYGVIYFMRCKKDYVNILGESLINKGTTDMTQPNTDDFSEKNAKLVTENAQLKEAIDAAKKKNEAIEGEIKSLQRKLIKLLEEKVNRLEGELRHVLRIDNIEKA